MTTLKEHLRTLALEAGAQKVGFARARAVDDRAVTEFQEWLQLGRHGEMGYLANYPEIRKDPRLLLDDATRVHTIMVCAFSYYHSEQQLPGAAKFAMYAHGSDYHEILRQRLQPIIGFLADNGETGRICIDSAPLRERYWAVESGVGFIGRNSQLIVPGMGSYFFLASIITTAQTEPDRPCRLSCGNCGACLKQCPGQAIGSDGSFDARRCISYLTIEHRGEMPAFIDMPDGSRRNIANILNGRVYGCDECQRVCPHNHRPPETAIEGFCLRPQLRGITCNEILSMTQETFSETFRKSPVKRAKLSGLQRNAAAAMPSPKAPDLTS